MGAPSDLIHPGAQGIVHRMTIAPPPPPGWRPRVRDDVTFRQDGGAWLLMDPQTGRIHTLDVAQALVWSYCDGERDVAALDRDVREAFGIARRDPGVRRALDHFRSEGLLEPPP